MKLLESNLKDKVFMYQSYHFGDVYYLPQMIITEFAEGINFTYNEAEQFIETVIQIYGKKEKVVYISNRINSYSVNPMDWIKIKGKFKNLKGIGIINYNKRMFCSYPIKDFHSLEEAYYWGIEIIEPVKSRGLCEYKSA